MVGDPSPALDSASELAQGDIFVKTSWSGSVGVVSVWGVVDALTAPQLTAAVQAAVDASPAALVVDLSEVEFLASAGMSVLVATQQLLGTSIPLAVVADGPVTRRPMKLLGLDSIVEMHRTLQDALADIAQDGESTG